MLIAEAESLLAGAVATEARSTTTKRSPAEKPRRVETPVVTPGAHADSDTMRNRFRGYRIRERRDEIDNEHD